MKFGIPFPKFNSSPLKSYQNPIGSRIVFLSHHFSGVNSLLNFGGARQNQTKTTHSLSTYQPLWIIELSPAPVLCHKKNRNTQKIRNRNRISNRLIRTPKKSKPTMYTIHGKTNMSPENQWLEDVFPIIVPS